MKPTFFAPIGPKNHTVFPPRPLEINMYVDNFSLKLLQQ